LETPCHDSRSCFLAPFSDVEVNARNIRGGQSHEVYSFHLQRFNEDAGGAVLIVAPRIIVCFAVLHASRAAALTPATA
jgi:hypothetical protein